MIVACQHFNSHPSAVYNPIKAQEQPRITRCHNQAAAQASRLIARFL
ncbi:MAG: hypothetical protein RQ715_05100 [Methylococcales bacterium]|nr:hypothetical protein [Methylococcales bacterium]